tara:strand:+ start:15287 stop:15712 length:426 start_codon:yes stop_codon:yes gene_type:complete
MQLIHCKTTDTIREETTNQLIAVKVNGRFLLDLDGNLPMGFIVRFIKVWHSVYRYCDTRKFIDALNNLMQGKSQIEVEGEAAPLFVETGFNNKGIESFLKRKGLLKKDYKKFSMFYDIEVNHLRFWLDDQPQGEITITLAE